MQLSTTTILLQLFFLISCFGNSSSNPVKTNISSTRMKISITQKDPYEMMYVAFEGKPEISEIKSLIEAVMDFYKLPLTNENKIKVGSMLVSLRKTNTVGVTEMDIFKHIYRYGSNKISLPDQAGISSTLLILEKKKHLKNQSKE